MFCKYCLVEIESYYLHVLNNKTHTLNLIKNYDEIIKNQYVKKSESL